MHPTNIDEWFPRLEQRKYVAQLQGQVGLTRIRAEYFVKLWAYLYIKQQHELGNNPKLPLTQLELPQGFVTCTHREAQEIFYTDQDRGSDRAAGMMIDKLVALGLIEKNFDGNTSCIRIRSSLPNNRESSESLENIQLIPDAFNPRTDTIPVATFLTHYYNWINKKPTVIPHRIARILRTWAAKYSKGMRVLRRCDNLQPVGFYILYPVSQESEESFFLPPSKSLFLNTNVETDPLQMAVAGLECTSIHVRSWQIDFSYKKAANICQLLKDVTNTLSEMQADFPNLCDMYTIPLHPADQLLASALGFQKTTQDPQLPLSWMYIPLDKFLAIDFEQAVANLKFD
jgi:hypothetical protein